MNKVDQINQIVEQLSAQRVLPYTTTISEIESGGSQHRGLYYIYPEVNFYFGKSDSQTATIHKRFHRNHGSKLRANPVDLYGPLNEKVQPRIQTPMGWRDGVAKYIFEDMLEYPEYYQVVGPRKVKPGVLTNECKLKVDIPSLPVLIWNLDQLTPKMIHTIETAVIACIEPYCNDETYKKRQAQKKK